MTRRDLLALPILAPLLQAETLPVHYRNQPPFAPYIGLIESGHDEFAHDPSMPPPPPVRDGLFADITGAVLDCDQLSKGIPYWIARLDPATGIDIYGNNGVAVGDIDGDGLDEIYVCQPAGLPNKLFRWRDLKLEDITATSAVGLLDATSSALFLDLRNLGRQDLVVLRSSGPALFYNDGRGNFTLVPGAFRFATQPSGGFTGMAAADYDRDGKLDLYLCCYSFFQSEAQFAYPTPYFDAQNGPPNFLFRNRLNADGSGHFEDVTASSGINENNNRYSFAPAWCDYDQSGHPSLYVANDFGRNNLYKNEGGRFRDVARDAGVEDLGPGMSACWFDENGNGLPDLYIANMFTTAGQQVVHDKAFPDPFSDAWRRHTKGNSFYRNLGNGKFADEGAQLGIEMGRWGWSADAADFDNDGKPELFLTCGMLTGSKQPDLMGFFWRQVVAKTPLDASPNAKYEAGWNAINQFLREGFSWNGNEPNVFYAKDGERYRDRSTASGLNYAEDSRTFALTDIDGDGCLDVVLKNRLGPQLRILENRCGQSRQRIALRLIGTKSNRDAIGARVRLDGQTKWITAGSGYLSQHTKTLHFGLKDSTAAERIEILWPSGLKQRIDTLAAGALYEIHEGGAPKRIRTFTPQAPRESKPIRADNLPRLHDTWLQDPVPLPDQRPGPGLVVITATELNANADLHAAYTLFRRYLFEHRAPLDLPLALLLNAAGQAVKIYSAVPSKAQVAQDLQLMSKPQALPYPGIEHTRSRRDYFKLGASLLWCGYPNYALPYLQAVLQQQPGNVRSMVLVAQIHREADRLTEARTLLDEALRLDPKSAEAWNELGGLAMAREDYTTALSHFEEANAAKTGLAFVLLNAAQASSKLGRQQKAETYYREALTADTKSSEAAQGLGLVLAKAGNFVESERFLLQAVELRPAFSDAWNNLGVLYLQQGQQAKAIKAMEQGIAAAPNEELLYLNLGRIYIQLKRPAEARQTMARLLAVQPQSAVAKKALEDLKQYAPQP